MEEDLQRLVESAASDGDAGFASLWREIEPALWDMVDRPRFASHLAHTEDTRLRIMSAIHAQLAADRCRYLQHYLDARRRNPSLGFRRWLQTVSKRIAMSYPSYDDGPSAVRRRSSRRILV